MEKVQKEYQVKLRNKLPKHIPLPEVGTITSEGDWYGHSFGDWVGRIFEDGTKESFFLNDEKEDSTRLFDDLLELGFLKENHHSVYDFEKHTAQVVTDYYVMRDVVGHCSSMPTVDDDYVDSCMNVQYEYTYEILLTLGDGYKRYITGTVITEGSFSVCFYEFTEDLKYMFEEWAAAGENGFSCLKEDSETIVVKFYDDYGNCLEHEVSIEELLRTVCSIRVIGLKKTIIEKHS